MWLQAWESTLAITIILLLRNDIKAYNNYNSSIKTL